MSHNIWELTIKESMLRNIGALELLVIFSVAILLFGPKRLPSLVAEIGKSIKAFRQSISDSDTTTNTIQAPDDNNDPPHK